MSEFVRGPWCECEEMPDVVIDADGYVVAEHVSQSDKSLVIAAPDLLEALQYMLMNANGRDLSQDESDAFDLAINMAESAINKATTIQ